MVEQTVILRIVYDPESVVAPADWDWAMVLAGLVGNGAVAEVEVVGQVFADRGVE